MPKAREQLEECVSSVLKSTSWVGMYAQDVVDHVSLTLPDELEADVLSTLDDLKSRELVGKHPRSGRLVWAGPKDGLWKRMSSEVSGLSRLRKSKR